MTNRVLYDSGDYCKKKEDCTTYRGSTCDTKTGLCVKPEDTANDHESKMCKVGSGMTDKEYNCGLEEMAAKYARKCLYTHSSTESRMTSEGEAGENLFTITISDAESNKAAQWATRAWFRELKDNGVGEDNILTRELLDRSKTEAFKDRRIGHYTQMVWGKTDKIGCAIQRCHGDRGDIGKKQTLAVCNYLQG
ncbi:SCP-like protein [Ancylostoma duodenale]|uniref:SCP-like protein n=1 Tax=Ancylostoma duodenale TaxID=51022 RepID=A0A0C2GAH2_9BILA|nr:SCP-like protein [Ancylostoma duodenale]